MQEKYPHDIVEFTAGEVPEGFVPLTDEEARSLKKQSAEERAKWLERRAELDDMFKGTGRGKKL